MLPANFNDAMSLVVIEVVHSEDSDKSVLLFRFWGVLIRMYAGIIETAERLFLLPPLTSLARIALRSKLLAARQTTSKAAFHARAARNALGRCLTHALDAKE
jgi:hypothetical protein